MKLKQLQCVLTVVQCDFNATAAAARLHISQPAVSKQIKMVEERLGFPIFRRNSKNLVSLTEMGKAILPHIESIMQSVANIRELSQNSTANLELELTVATTNTLATYGLSPLLPDFQRSYPHIPINLVEGSNAQILQMLQERETDFGWFSTGHLSAYANELKDMFYLPVRAWHAVLLLPPEHRLAGRKLTGLKDLANEGLITYVTSHKEPSTLAEAMAKEGCSPKIVLTARNTELIKGYVRQGLGLGIIADLAYDPANDRPLAIKKLDRWLPPFMSYLVWHRDMRLRNFHYDFINKINPQASRKAVDDHMRQSAAPDEGWAI